MKKNISTLLIASVLSISFLIGCSNKKDDRKEDIVILYTTDVHCGIDNNIGYISLSAYRNEMEKEYKYVTLLDSGDAISGDYVGAISKGEYIIDIMNEVNYDFMVIGNHEFDYGMDILKERFNEFNGDVLSCNFKYIGKHENKFSDVKPYKIIDYGSKKVGYVGVTTPFTISESTPSYFMEDGEFAYSFSNDTPEEFYTLVQNNINACYELDADYVLLVTHLGYGDNYYPYSSKDIIEHTYGVNAVLDGHAHKEVDTEIINSRGISVPLLDAGYQMNDFGKIVISNNGELSASLISGYEGVDERTQNKIDEIKKEVEQSSKKVIGTSDITLKIADEDGIRMVRNRETPIGNMVADAYRVNGESDIAVVNGGGIRNNLYEGDITFGELQSIHPFGNTLCVVKTTGQKILDYLEYVNNVVEKEYFKYEDGKKIALGENGGFASVSGLKFDVDTSIKSSVITDENGTFVSVAGDRRVKNVKVLENNQYVDLDINKEYTLASHNYLLVDAGGGANMFVDDEMVRKDIMLDYEALIKYVTDIRQGKLKDLYSTTEGRINIY